jgi:arylsulfatase A-like enzyme
MVCAVIGALLVAAVDVFGAWRRPDVDAAQVAPVLGGLAVLAGFAVGGLATALTLLWRALFGGYRRFEGLAALGALAGAPFLWLLAEGALTGGAVRQLLSPVWSVPVATIILALSSGAAVAAAGWLLERRYAGRMDKTSMVLGTVALCGLCLAGQWLNGHAYVRLYPRIHAALGWFAWGCAMLAAALWIGPLLAFREESKTSARLLGRRFFIVVAVASGVLLTAAVFAWRGLTALRTSHSVRFAVVDSSPFGREIIELNTLVRSLGKRAPARAGARNQWGGTPPLAHPGRGSGAGENPPAVDAAAAYREGLLDRRGHSVLLITIDALRADRLHKKRGGRKLAAYLSRWAKRSCQFEQAYCHAPHSSFSLSSLLTGEPIRSLVALGQPLPPTLATLLNRAGYATSAFCTRGILHTAGKKLETYWDDRFGFGRFDPNGYDAEELTRRALSALDQLRAGDRPFFLWVHYFDVHEPYRRHKSHDFGKQPVDRYDSEVAYTDRRVMRLIQTARAKVHNLIVVVTADHGEEFGEHGGHFHGSSLYEEQVRVPLIFAVPGVSPRVIARPTSLLSVAPTLLDLLGLPLPDGLVGRTLVPRMVQRNPASPPPVFAEVETKRMVAEGRHKLIVDSWRRTVELYDLKKDPHERKNLADRHQSRVQNLRWLLGKYLAQLGHRSQSLPEPLALARLGGARGHTALCRLLNDPRTQIKHRVEAARRLGKMKGGCSVAALKTALFDGQPRVAQEAAVALGELRWFPVAPALRHVLLTTGSTELRHRAAIAAGRVKMRVAVPYLIAALSSPNRTIRYRASHYLGQVGGPEALPALFRVAADEHAKHLVAVSIGQVGRRSPPPQAQQALSFLMQWFPTERSPHVLRSLAKALGYLARPEAFSVLLPLVGRKDLPEVREALVRCGALGRVIWGVDFGPAAPAAAPAPAATQWQGVSECKKQHSALAFSFLGYTTCKLRLPVTVTFPVNAVSRRRTVLLRLHYAAAGRPAAATPSTVQVRLNGRLLGKKRLVNGWQDLRFSSAPGDWKQGPNRITLTGTLSNAKAVIQADHLLVF